jgi:hypothetical protein
MLVSRSVMSQRQANPISRTNQARQARAINQVRQARATSQVRRAKLDKVDKAGSQVTKGSKARGNKGKEHREKYSQVLEKETSRSAQAGKSQLVLNTFR